VPGTTIRAASETVCAVSGYAGKMVWSADEPDGVMLKVLDVTRMTRAPDGWRPPTDLCPGFEETNTRYRANKAQADARW
jgi:hypothetical protein